MSPKKNKILIFFKALPKNIFSGFVVSLIALPLALGLAMASEAPPISGIITAIIGGIMVSALGGSYVTITGPGNGLVGVLLVAIITLGLNDAYAAIICSGVLLLTLGFLRMGKLADFFPSSAIQGMLAAIGLIILGKQFHIMMGNRISKDNNVDYLLEIPNTIISAFSYSDKGCAWAAIIGVLSLGLMVFYPKLRNKYLQLIPAPMWIVLLSIGFSYYYELALQQPNPIHSDYMISGIPDINQIITQIPTPDFENIISIPFWNSVISLTLIASIESLLSIKAIDKLDPEKRRSNVNKDLKALGLATVGSGFLGGLNVVTVIARSSVNVNNGGTNRSSNFFHAIFLIIFIALFSTQLTRIPLPALMAILVFTGYKLASPNLVKRIFSIGKEQIIIFLVTLIVTLKISLISGITSGVIITFLIHILINKSFTLFARNILKPNVLMFKESNGNYYISVKHFCSFLNFYKLRNKLEDVPEDQDVVLDFSMCNFVDHTVMENLYNYQELFNKKGGNFDVVGLDMHGTGTDHPFALRRLIPFANIFTKNLTKRQLTLGEIANDYNFNYKAEKTKEVAFIENFLFFKVRQIDYVFNQIISESDSILFDISYHEGEFIAKEDIKTTMFYFKLNKNIPEFRLDKEGFLEKIYAFAGFKDIPFKEHEDFSKRFYLLGENEAAIKQLFNAKLIRFFESNPYYHVESNGSALLIFSRERLASVKEIKALIDFGNRLNAAINP